MKRTRVSSPNAAASNAEMHSARADRPLVARVAAVCCARYSALPVWLA
jgi:hypothetical protein